MSSNDAVLGADGCPGGWIGALVSGPTVTWHLYADAAALLSVPVAVTAVDIPIGLPEAGVRACDVLARQRLPGQGSSVFPAPVRAVLAAATYAEARALSVAVDGRSLSAQCFGIVPKVADVDRALDRAVAGEVLEVHPEVSFALLAGGPLPRKRSAAGALARVQLLTGVFGALPTDVPAQARLDDCLDALVCAWTAQRWLRGEAEVLGGEVDAAGRVMRIVV
jgi:predicted RNase H-like nuclease